MNLISLERALRENDILLVDGSARALRNHNGDDTTYASFGNFALIPMPNLQERVTEFCTFGAIIGSPCARTIPQVAEEVDTFLHGIISGYNKLDQSDSFRSNKEALMDILNGTDEELKKRLGTKELFNLASSKNRQNYSVLIRRVRSCVGLLRRKSIRISDPTYESFVEMIKLVDRHSGIKKSTRKKMQFPDYDPLKVDLPDTDERLVATAYWISILSDKKVGVIAKDNDFFGLFTVIPKVLGAGDFMHYNDLFRRKLHTNYIRFYYMQDESVCEKMSTYDVHTPKDFALFRASEEAARDVKRQISGFWREFFEYHTSTGVKFEG